MSAAFAADAVLVLHLLFIALVVFGGLLAVWDLRLAGLHLPALAWGIWVIASHRICPLTPLENRRRAQAGEQGYSGGFIEHYLVPIIYPAGLTPAAQWVMAAAMAVANVLLYGWAIRRWRKRTVNTVAGPPR